MTAMSEYTPTNEEIESVYGRVHDAHGIPGQSPERRAEFRRWLAAHDAEVRASVLADVRWLADARDEYTDERVQFQTASVRQVADIIDGTNDGFGWLPSWRWDAWTARLRLSGRVPVEQGDET